MALKVEEDITLVGPRHQLETMPQPGVVAHLDQFVRKLLAVGQTGLHLQRRLAHQPVLAGSPDAAEFLAELGQPGQGDDAPDTQRLALGSPDAGDEDQRILITPVFSADREELTELAVRALLRHRRGLRARVERGRELAAQPSPVRPEFAHPQGLRPSGSQPDVHPLGGDAGVRFDGVGIEAQLKHVSRFGVDAGELGVYRLVADAAVGQVDANQKVGDPTHAVVNERHLVDHVVTVGERVADPFDPCGEALLVAPLRNGEHRFPLRAIRGEALFFVQFALLLQQSGERTEVAVRFVEPAGIDLPAQRQVVRAVQPRGDLRRRHQSFSHRAPLAVLTD